MTPEELAIARSVLYASLFDYPLTLAQLRQALIESTQTPTEIIQTYAHGGALQAAIEHRGGFFFPRGQEHLLAERRRREARSRSFLRHHRFLLGLVCALPYVRLVALSGSRRVMRAVPHARLAVLDRCGHLPMLEQSEAFNRAVAEVLRAVEAAPLPGARGAA